MRSETFGRRRGGYINAKGEYVVSPNYEDAGTFAKNGLAAVKEYKENSDGKWGYIDANGTQVIPFQFDKAESFNEKGQAIVALGEKYGMIDARGTYIMNPQFDSLSEEVSGKLLAFETSGKSGYADKTGTYVIQPDFIKLSGIYSDGYIVYVDDSKKIGIIDSTGKKPFENTYDEISYFSSDDFCKQEGCGEIVYGSNEYCYEHAPKTSSSKLPYCDAYGCWNRVPYSWRDYCDKHIYLEY